MGKGRGWTNATVVTKPQAGTISKGQRAVIIRAAFLKITRKAAGSLILALILALHSLVVCTAAAQCIAPSSHALHQNGGCHHHPHDGSKSSQGCECCDSIICSDRAELARPDTSTSSERTMFVLVRLGTLFLNHAPGGNWPAVLQSLPLHSPVRIFLIQRTLLI